MKKGLKNSKKILLIMIILLIFVVIGAIIFITWSQNTNVRINDINKENYSFKYDSTWKIIEENDTEVTLLHKKSKSTFDIQINELEDEMQYKELDEIFDNLLYNIQEQNETYNLLYKENTTITKNNIEGYKILFENDNSQAVVYFYKQGSKLVTFIYEATYEYFDILLDSVNNIIYNFSLNEQKFDVITNINLETKQIVYSEQPDIVNLLNDTKEEQIASLNYLVKYSIPSNFRATDYDTEYAYYTFQDLQSGESLTLSTSILNRNLYEYLDRESSTNIYSNYNLNSYNQANEALDKFGDEPLSYIYKNNYLTNNQTTENIEIVFELNESHILRMVISSRKVGIPEELVKMIKINEIQNIANNIKIEKQEGFIVGHLKSYIDYKAEETEEITLRVPETFKEIDKGTNLYEERNYGLNYNTTREEYDYEVTYKRVSSDIQRQLEILDSTVNKNYGEYKGFVALNDITANDKNFKVYQRDYIELSNGTDDNGNRYRNNVNEIVLFYELQNNNYLVIIIKANNKNANELINQLINFDVKVI